MMNDKMEKFERRLQNQPLKKIPAAWRGEILTGAREAAAPKHAGRQSLTRSNWLMELFWPHPAAWASLAAIWTGLCVLNVSTGERAPVMAEKTLPPAPEVVAQLKNQQRLYAELLGANEPAEADRPKTSPIRPRTQLTASMTA